MHEFAMKKVAEFDKVEKSEVSEDTAKNRAIRKDNYTLTVGQLKGFLQDVISELDSYDDDSKLRVVGNTFWIQSDYYMQFGNKGFVDLSEIQLDDEDDYYSASAKKSKTEKSVFENIEDYRLVRDLDNAISNFEVNAKILVEFFNKEMIDTYELYDRIECCRGDLKEIEMGIPDLEAVATGIGMGKSESKKP